MGYRVIDYHAEIYLALCGGFYEKHDHYYESLWREYIIDLDIGIICHNIDYVVVDERKWMLARIKYGI